jgi:hypothetical protein
VELDGRPVVARTRHTVGCHQSETPPSMGPEPSEVIIKWRPTDEVFHAGRGGGQIGEVLILPLQACGHQSNHHEPRQTMTNPPASCTRMTS